ncbi:MAG TPA: DUF2157 domain-containing protein [Actinomycetota bacterium]|nr:DUF2157 domain-containing protein [Actinomycetota bacterium]
MPADLDHPPATDPVLREDLRRWVAASLITPAEADAIRAFEGRLHEAEPRRIPMITEALAYVGAALAAAAGVVLLGERWSDLTPGVRVASVAIGFAVALVGGLLLRGRRGDPAIERLMSVLWGVATGLFGWLAWLLAHDVLDLRGSTPALWCGIAVTALGGVLYLFLREGLQQIAVFAGLLTIVGASVDPGTGLTVVVWGIGVGWIVLGALNRLPPERAAFIGGPLVALWAPIALTNGGEGYGMWLGLATAVGLIVASLGLHQTVLLAFGTIGVFAYLVRVIERLFGDTAAMPVTLLIAGATVIAVAVWLARRSARRASRSARRSPS